MKYYVIINGESSLDIQGLAIESLPAISKPLMRSKREEIDGRNGDIITQLGFSAYDKTLKIGLWGDYDINEVITFFNQDGIITFSNEPDMYYNFTILNRIDFINQLEAFRKATITIHCQPFKYKEEETETLELEEHQEEDTSFNLEGTYEAPMQIDLKGNTSQVQLTGKNLFDKSTAIVGQNWNGDTLAYSIASDYIEVEENKQYTISISNMSEYVSTTVVKFDENKQVQLPAITTNPFTIPSGIKYIKLSIRSATTHIWTQSELDNAKYQLEQGSATSYEPYCGGTPSPNPSYPQDIHNVSGNNSVVVCGKNLIFSVSKSGNTLRLNNAISENEYIFKAGTYKLSFESSISPSVYMKTATTSSTNVGNTSPITINANEDFSLWFYKSGILETDVSNIQLEKGNQATTYEAYQSQTYPINLPVGMELCKIGTYQDNFLRNSGKNLIVPFSYTREHNGITFTYLLDGSINLNGTSTGTAFAIANADVSTYTKLPVGTYTLSGGISDVLLRFDDNTGTNVANTSSSTQFIINSEMNCYIQLRIPSGKTFNNVKIYPMINEGSTALPFEPCGNGEWYLHKETGKVVLNGSETDWESTGTNVFTTYLNGYIHFKQNEIGLCNYYNFNSVQTSVTNTLQNGEFALQYNDINRNRLFFKNTSISSSNDFKTWLSTHNTIVYYVLANTTYTKITDTTLLSQLEAIKEAQSYLGNTNINQVNNDMPFILDVSYLSGTDNITITNHGNYYSKPKLTLTGTGNIGIYLNDSQIFQVALGTNETIIIDTDKMEAYYESTLKNRQVIGDYNSFKLLSGENTIKISGTFSKLQVDNYSRWI